MDKCVHKVSLQGAIVALWKEPLHVFLCFTKTAAKQPRLHFPSSFISSHSAPHFNWHASICNCEPLHHEHGKQYAESWHDCWHSILFRNIESYTLCCCKNIWLLTHQRHKFFTYAMYLWAFSGEEFCALRDRYCVGILNIVMCKKNSHVKFVYTCFQRGTEIKLL